jgi:hypothetical protein
MVAMVTTPYSLAPMTSSLVAMVTTPSTLVKVVTPSMVVLVLISSTCSTTVRQLAPIPLLTLKLVLIR